MKQISVTGDIANNLAKLRKELKRMAYSAPIDFQAVQMGNPSELLPILHFCLLSYSKLLYGHLSTKGYDLFSKTDLRFLEATWKLARQEFDYQPQVASIRYYLIRHVCCSLFKTNIIFAISFGWINSSLTDSLSARSCSCTTC
jgi:hypothetical protein